MKKLREIWAVLMTGDPMLVMWTVFWGSFAVLWLAAIIFAAIYSGVAQR